MKGILGTPTGESNGLLLIKTLPRLRKSIGIGQQLTSRPGVSHMSANSDGAQGTLGNGVVLGLGVGFRGRLWTCCSLLLSNDLA